MSTTEDKDNNPEPAKLGGKQPGSLVLIGFCVVVLVIFAAMLSNPEQVVEWGSKYLGWKTPKQQCIQNLKYIDGAIQQWALENKKAATDTYSLTDTEILAYLRGSVLPLCPRGGKYSAAKLVHLPPLCSVPGHTL